MGTAFASDEELRAVVAGWLGGCDRFETLARAGRNNRVYYAEYLGCRYVCKQYYRNPDESQSVRQDREWRFARWANEAAPGRSPEALFKDDDFSLSLFAFVEGRALQNPIAEEWVADAFSFLRLLNSRERPREAFPEAADSCFSVQEHFAHVARRLDRFEALSEGAGIGQVKQFVAAALRPVFVEARARVEILCRELGVSMEARLKHGQRVLSPSDFGFHNALQTTCGEIVYLDFEYAGWDDPVKCVCDFFAQPDFPAPLSSLARAIDAMPRKEGRPVERLAVGLLPLYVVKWTCILLNPFLSTVQDRRAFSGSDNRRGDEVLLAARAYFEQHPSRSLESWPT